MAYTGPASQTYHSGNASNGYNVTRREQWIPEIWYHQPIETPLLADLPRVSVNNTLVQWPLGYLDFDFTSNTILADAEGEAVDPSNQRYRYRASNNTHIMKKSFMVSRTQRSMSEVGVADEYDQQLWECSVELKQEFEKALLWSREATGDASTARSLNGLIPWTYMCAQATRPQIAADTIPSDFTSTWYAKSPDGNLTRDELNDEILLPFFNAGGQLGRAKMIVGPKLKLVISTFAHSFQGSGPTMSATPVNDRTVAAANNTVYDAIDYFQTDFGLLKVGISRYLSGSSSDFTLHDSTYQSGTVKTVTPDDVCVLYDPSYLKLGVLEDFFSQDLPIDGDRQAGYVGAEMTLMVMNPKALVGGDGLTA